MASTFLSAALLVLASIASVNAESHTIKFDNKCGFGTPQLIQGNTVVTTTSFTSSGVFSGIAYLQTGSCGFNGEGCSLIEMTMTNPGSVVGGGSSADISLITPHTFNVASTIQYFDSCDSISTTCESESCNTAFKQPDDTWVQIACQDNNANLLITFCPEASSSNTTQVTTKQATTTKSTTAQTTPTTTAKVQAKVQATTEISSTKTTSVITRTSSTPTASKSVASSSPSALTCKGKRSARRAIRAHRKRGGGRSFH